MNMKLKLLIVLFSLSFVGCNTFKKLTMQPESKASNTPAIPDDYTVTGVTITDSQWVQPIRCIDSDVIVKVLRPGETDWHICNKYEVKLETVGTGGGGILFRRICYPTFDANGKLINLIITQKSVAPVGTKYEIRSVLKVVDHSLY